MEVAEICEEEGEAGALAVEKVDAGGGVARGLEV